MIREIEVTNMEDSDINEAKKIWVRQFELYCDNSEFPLHWEQDTELLEKFLAERIKNQSAVVAKLDNKVVGFLAYDEFPSSIEEYKESVYLELYKSISQEWINKNIFNHMWTIFFNDINLKNILFDLGYGSYLIDAFNDCNIESGEKSMCDIRKATMENATVLYELVEESNEYYASAPLFLKRDRVTKEEVEEIILKRNVFIAWHEDVPVGFINLSIADNNNFIDMSVKNCGLIDEIGAYIKLE